jgi:hypothetical protein
MLIVEKLVEWRLAGETKVLGENLPQRHFFNQKTHMTRPGFEPGPQGGKPATNRLTYGAAWRESIFFYLVCEAIGTVATPVLLCQPRVIVNMIVEKQMNVDWQGKPKFSEKTCPSATFAYHKIPHDQTRVWTRAAAVGSRRLTAWAMARPDEKVGLSLPSTKWHNSIYTGKLAGKLR